MIKAYDVGKIRKGEKIVQAKFNMYNIADFSRYFCFYRRQGMC